jgi:hypothetical protein
MKLQTFWKGSTYTENAVPICKMLELWVEQMGTQIFLGSKVLLFVNRKG